MKKIFVIISIMGVVSSVSAQEYGRGSSPFKFAGNDSITTTYKVNFLDAVYYGSTVSFSAAVSISRTSLSLTSDSDTITLDPTTALYPVFVKINSDTAAIDSAARLSVGTGSFSSAITKAEIRESFASQQATGLRIRGIGSSSGIWKGRLIAGGDNVVFLMGEYNSQAWLGSHNTALSGWTSFYINPDGAANLYLGKDVNGSTQPLLTLNNNTALITQAASKKVIDSLYVHREVSSLGDTGEITFATGVAGWGEVMAGDNQEWASFRFTSAGVVTLIANTANVTTTNDNDTTLNIYDGGSGIVIENQLGSTLKIAININYYTP